MPLSFDEVCLRHNFEDNSQNIKLRASTVEAPRAFKFQFWSLGWQKSTPMESWNKSPYLQRIQKKKKWVSIFDKPFESLHIPSALVWPNRSHPPQSRAHPITPHTAQYLWEKLWNLKHVYSTTSPTPTSTIPIPLNFHYPSHHHNHVTYIIWSQWKPISLLFHWIFNLQLKILWSHLVWHPTTPHLGKIRHPVQVEQEVQQGFPVTEDSFHIRSNSEHCRSVWILCSCILLPRLDSRGKIFFNVTSRMVSCTWWHT